MATVVGFVNTTSKNVPMCEIKMLTIYLCIFMFDARFSVSIIKMVVWRLHLIRMCQYVSFPDDYHDRNIIMTSCQTVKQYCVQTFNCYRQWQL